MSAVDMVEEVPVVPEVKEPPTLLDSRLDYKKHRELIASRAFIYKPVAPSGSVPSISATSSTSCSFILPPDIYSYGESYLRVSMTVAAGGAGAYPVINNKAAVFQGITYTHPQASDPLFQVNGGPFEMESYFQFCREMAHEDEIISSCEAGANAILLTPFMGTELASKINSTGNTTVLPAGDSPIVSHIQASAKDVAANAIATLASNLSDGGLWDDLFANYTINNNANTALSVTYLLPLSCLKASFLANKDFVPMLNAQTTLTLTFAPSNNWVMNSVLTIAGGVVTSMAAPTAASITVNSMGLFMAALEDGPKREAIVSAYNAGDTFKILVGNPVASSNANTSVNGYSWSLPLNPVKGNLVGYLLYDVNNLTDPRVNKFANTSTTVGLSTCGSMLGACRSYVNGKTMENATLTLLDRFVSYRKHLSSPSNLAHFVANGAPYLHVETGDIPLKDFDFYSIAAGIPRNAAAITNLQFDINRNTGILSDGAPPASEANILSQINTCVLLYQRYIYLGANKLEYIYQ